MHFPQKDDAESLLVQRLFSPAIRLIIKPHEVQGAKYDGVGKLVKVGWTTVERWCTRKNDAASAGHGLHIVDVDRGKWGFPNHTDQLAALLEDDVGGAGGQVVGNAVGNAAQGSHGAGYNDHVHEPGGAGGKWSEVILAVIDLKWTLKGFVKLLLPNRAGIAAQDYTHFHIVPQGQMVEHPLGINTATRSRHRNNDLIF